MLPGWRVDREAVTGRSRDDVEVGVGHLLEGDFAVRQEEVDPVARQTRRAQSRGEPLTHDEQVRPEILGDVCERRKVVVRDDEQVARCDRVVIEERRHALIAIHQRGIGPADRDAAEDAISGRIGCRRHTTSIGAIGMLCKRTRHSPNFIHRLLEALPVRPSRRTFEAAEAAILLVELFGIGITPFASCEINLAQLQPLVLPQFRHL